MTDTSTTKSRKLVAGGRLPKRSFRISSEQRLLAMYVASVGKCMLATAWGPCSRDFDHTNNHVCGGRHGA